MSLVGATAASTVTYTVQRSIPKKSRYLVDLDFRDSLLKNDVQLYYEFEQFAKSNHLAEEYIEGLCEAIYYMFKPKPTVVLNFNQSIYDETNDDKIRKIVSALGSNLGENISEIETTSISSTYSHILDDDVDQKKI